MAKPQDGLDTGDLMTPHNRLNAIGDGLKMQKPANLKAIKTEFRQVPRVNQRGINDRNTFKYIRRWSSAKKVLAIWILRNIYSDCNSIAWIAKFSQSNKAH